MPGSNQNRTRRLRPNYLLTVLSVGLVLFVLGAYGLLAWNSDLFIKWMKERLDVLVEFEDKTPDESVIQSLQAAVKDLDGVKDSSVVYISNKQALRDMERQMGEDFLLEDMPNPFAHIISFNVEAEHFNPLDLNEMKETLLREDAVKDVYYQDGILMEVEQNMRRAGHVLLVLGIVFLLVAFTLIHNTIKLALYAQRFEIKTMELVGATDGFILRPFLWKATKQGFYSGLIALLMLGMCLYGVYTMAPSVLDLFNYKMLAYPAMVIIGMGIVLSVLSTRYVVKKYLHTNLEQLY